MPKPAVSLATRRGRIGRRLAMQTPGSSKPDICDDPVVKAPPSSGVGWNHLIRHPDDAAHAFRESDERTSLLGRAYEPPQMDAAAGHNDVSRTKIRPLLIAQARQQLQPD